VLLKVRDDVSTDEILPAGTQVLPFRSNIHEISRFAFSALDAGFYERARSREGKSSLVVAGSNYGQGSSREHAALVPRYLGVRAVLARSFARIHHQNLVNFGVLPLVFADPDDYERIQEGDDLELADVRSRLPQDQPIEVHNHTRSETYRCSHGLTSRQIEMVVAGGLIPSERQRIAAG
jgi:aconitate hydratase